jgi:hypothetical protein
MKNAIGFAIQSRGHREYGLASRPHVPGRHGRELVLLHSRLEISITSCAFLFRSPFARTILFSSGHSIYNGAQDHTLLSPSLALRAASLVA